VHRAIGSRSPSLAVAVAMHNFSVATLVEVYLSGSGLEGLLLEAIATQDRLVASGFSEGQTGRGILEPSMEARRTKDGVIINGSKKPCSLTWSMDLLTASVRVVDETDTVGDKLAVVLIPANAEGLERKRFWKSGVLAGAESDMIVLKDVKLEERLVYPLSDDGRVDSAQISGFLWFEILLASSYLGVASALTQRVLQSGKGTAADRTRLGIEIEGAAAALEGIARSMVSNPRGKDELGRMLLVRYAVQGAIERSTALALELLGGIAFAESPEITYLFSAAHALGLHPPNRTKMIDELAKFLSGAAYEMK
jgi:alkylation response protein AidB-like acyl-CoA dehydrogenase